MRYRWSWLPLWAGMCTVFVLYLSGFSESDATKYFLIADHMQRTHQYLLPFWQGHVYSDKPPLLFWMIIAGWQVFGQGRLWLQILPLIFATGTLFVTRHLAKQLWPDKEDVVLLVPFVLLGCLFFTWFSKQIRVDAMLAFSVVASVSALVATLQSTRWLPWVLYTLAMGLAGFAKGPVILVFITLPVLFTVFWHRKQLHGLKTWLWWFVITTLIGMAIPLTWAIPAAFSGGHHYGASIFYKQIAHRAQVKGPSVWFYIVRMPLWLLPWVIFAPLWTRFRMTMNFGFTLCVSIIVFGLLVFSLFGQKLPHYLFPLFPFFALLIAVRLSDAQTLVKRWHAWPVALLLLGIGAVLVLWPYLTPLLSVKAQIRTLFMTDVGWVWPSVLVLMSMLLLFVKYRSLHTQVLMLTISALSLAVFLNGPLLSAYQTRMTSAPMLQQLSTLPDMATLAVVGKVVDAPLRRFIRDKKIRVLQRGELDAFLKQHKQAWVIVVNQDGVMPACLGRVWFYQMRYSVVALCPLRSIGPLLR